VLLAPDRGVGDRLATEKGPSAQRRICAAETRSRLGDGSTRCRGQIERGRDRTHVRNLTSGELVDAFARAGLRDIQLSEDPFELDFDEWFDRGTPASPKSEVRAALLSGNARGFTPRSRPDGGVTIGCIRVMVRGTR